MSKSYQSKHVKARTQTPSSISSQPKSNIPKKQYSHPTMKPYTVLGKKYYPTIVRVGDEFNGISSWYGPNFNGKLTSNGEIYDMHAMTAAHKTLPMNTIVRVNSLDSGKSTIVRINDRGPFVGTRIIDLSNAAAHKIDMVKKGTANVHLEILGFQDVGQTEIGDISDLKKNGPSEVYLGSYAVQIASFSKMSGAIITQEKHDGFEGHKAIIKDTGFGDKQLYRVWLSGFRSEDEARDFVKSDKYQYDFIVRDE